MSYIQDRMEDYLDDISRAVQNGNKSKVISLINEMKNFYMVEEDLKPGTKKETKKKLENPTKVIGTVIEVPKSDKPRKHIFY